MSIPRTAIFLAQRKLQAAGFDPGKIDGYLGDQTYRAAREALQEKAERLPKDWQTWSGPRNTVAYLQLLCLERGIEAGAVDGYWGPQTAHAVESLEYLDKRGQLPTPWRDDEPEPKHLVLPAQAQRWPRQTQDELVKFFGEPGKHQVSIKLPYPHRLAWDTAKTIETFACHEKVHDSMDRVLNRVLSHYGQERIRDLRLDLWGGCLNVRKTRGGSNWSMHSWGIAIDYDPEYNQLKWGKDRARFARPEYDAWWELWEEEGWISLGRARNFDWMHVQAARLK